MKKNIIQYCALAFLAFVSFSCEKDFGDNLGPTQDSVADIPVTVTNATYFERFATVTTTLATSNNVVITMEIPAGSGVIREITKVATGISGTNNLGNLNNTAVGTAYNTTGAGTAASPFVLRPIPGNGTNQITFTTNLTTDYLPYRTRNGAAYGPLRTTGTPPVVVSPSALPLPSATTIPTEIQYYFRLTLEDGRTIVPMPVRVRIID
ncbi:hypothetical protein [Hymenobacter canadensis]|uniref:DUF1735 domain-containing protein n=1 Tax=Hymenobacter canadensis TaxID=2999067 RepID=A0ABY7LLB4_9BACT|nr:hypothetical protein [Hymenobacter canadensis]WBA40237.1 hypothetical protein O3303_10370 [Hymenobacter canadensis]